MDVVFYDPYVPDGRDKALGVRRVETLDDLLAEAHVVSPHCPLTAETQHIDQRRRRSPRCSPARSWSTRPAAAWSTRRRFPTRSPRASWPAPASTCWRTSRRRTTIRCWSPGAIPITRPITALIVNPHAAFYCEEGLLDMRVKGTEACRRALLGLPLRNVVN